MRRRQILAVLQLQGLRVGPTTGQTTPMPTCMTTFRYMRLDASGRAHPRSKIGDMRRGMGSPSLLPGSPQLALKCCVRPGKIVADYMIISVSPFSMM